MTFDRAQLEHALELNAKGHALMKWLGDREPESTGSLERLHAVMSVAEATRAWVERNHGDFPPACRPAPEDVAQLGNLVGTYLETSFELAPDRERGVSDSGCMCPTCTRLVGMGSLRTRKLTRHDKLDARAIVLACAVERAVELGCARDDPRIQRVANELREQIAMVAWARELLRRLAGDTVGPAALALWRMFAWLPTGSPRPGFAITADAILDAGRRLDSALAPRSASSSAAIDDLLREVYAHPQDDGVRAVLADALLAAGDPRGELIALQLDLAIPGHTSDQKLDRVEELLRTHGAEWLGELARVQSSARFTRGFVSELTLGRAPWTAIQRRAHDRELGTIESLAASWGFETAYAQFVTSPMMRALRQIQVWDPITVAALEATPAQLEHVSCVRWNVDPFPHALGVQVFAACERITSLHSIGIDVAQFDALAHSPLFGRIDSLTVGGELDAALRLWPRLPPAMSLTISAHARLGRTSGLHLVRTARGVDATITGEWAASRVAAQFARLPELVRLAVVGPTWIHEILASIPKRPMLEIDLVNARPTGYLPAP